MFSWQFAPQAVWKQIIEYLISFSVIKYIYYFKKLLMWNRYKLIFIIIWHCITLIKAIFMGSVPKVSDLPELVSFFVIRLVVSFRVDHLIDQCAAMGVSTTWHSRGTCISFNHLVVVDPAAFSILGVAKRNG